MAGHQLHCSGHSPGHMTLGLYVRALEIPWGFRIGNHYPEASHSHQEPFPLPAGTFGVRRIAVPQPGLRVGSSVELYPKFREKAHRLSTPCIEQLPTGLVRAANEGRH